MCASCTPFSEITHFHTPYPLPPLPGITDELSETKDTIEVNGQVFHKPFVEKPLSAEDHNVHIYFPSDYGGGCQKLFRKVMSHTIIKILSKRHAVGLMSIPLSVKFSCKKIFLPASYTISF